MNPQEQAKNRHPPPVARNALDRFSKTDEIRSPVPVAWRAPGATHRGITDGRPAPRGGGARESKSGRNPGNEDAFTVLAHRVRRRRPLCIACPGGRKRDPSLNVGKRG